MVSFPQGSRAGADTVCGCKQNHSYVLQNNSQTLGQTSTYELPIRVCRLCFTSQPRTHGLVQRQPWWMSFQRAGLAAPSVQRHAAAAAAAAATMQHHIITHAHFWRYLNESRAWNRGYWPITSDYCYFWIIPKVNSVIYRSINLQFFNNYTNDGETSS